MSFLEQVGGGRAKDLRSSDSRSRPGQSALANATYGSGGGGGGDDGGEHDQYLQVGKESTGFGADYLDIWGPYFITFKFL